MNTQAITHCPLILACAALAYTSAASANGSELDQVYEFLESHAVNRTMLWESEGTLAGGTVGYAFRREATFCNLVRLPIGFQYDEVYRISQKNWDLEGGEKNGDTRTEDRLMVLRYEYAFRESTGEIVGCSHTLTKTRKKCGGNTTTFRMKLHGDHLEIQSQTGRYDDHFGPGGSFYAGATADTQNWFIREEKLARETQTKVYRVDPETLERELIDDRKPIVEQEIARMPLE